MQTLTALLSLVMLVGLSPAALAQAFPTRPVTIVVPFGPGGTTDVLARGLGAEMSKVLG